MLIHLLGLLDIFAGLSIFLLPTPWEGLVWFAVFYLVAKSLLSLRSLASIVDLAVAILFVVALLGHTTPLVYIGTVWLVQKGVISFL